MIISTSKQLLRKPTICFQCIKTVTVTSSNFDSDNESNNSSKTKKEIAAEKLNSLLKSIIQDESQLKHTDEVIMTTKPRVSMRKKALSKLKKDKTLGEKIFDAAQEVAKTVEGDKKETEMMLLQKLLYKDTTLKEEIVKASSSSLNLSELLVGMDIEKPDANRKTYKKETTVSRASQIRSALQRQGERKKYSQLGPISRSVDSVNIFEAKPLGIFRTEKMTTDDITLKTWDECLNREIQLTVTHPPSNIYEQMIIWTERGILWKFPIDNEQGMDAEKKTSFTDHVFLENHLEGWCPTMGPIRHFMELVCVGLSRNHWLTATEKKEHIMWYKDFFSSKKELIKEVGAGEIVSSPQV